MDRREFLRTSGIVATAILTTPISEIKAKNKNHERPNVLFVFTDQQTIKTMGCSGNVHLKTPAMDNLAAKGVRFEKSYCTSPVCGPSRSSLVSSRMPHETGYNFNPIRSIAIPDFNFQNMGDIFRSADYNTVWAGKWHLPESYPLRANSSDNSINGFDLLPFYDSTKNYPEWGYGDVTDEPLADSAVKYIKNYSDKKPFLLAVSFCNPHDVCYVPRKPEKFLEPEIDEKLPPLPANFDVDPMEPELLQKKRKQKYYGDEIILTKDFVKKDWQRYIYEYNRMTERVDKQVGRVVNALEEKGLLEKTIIIFTSDHGDGVASHKWAAKLSLYEESVAVPFIISWKGKIPAGVVDSKHLVSGLDVLPTFCDYAGIPNPKNTRGESLRTILDDPKSDWREFVVTELATDPKNPDWKGRMCRTDRYKYNLYSKGERNEQLFDMLKDPGETQNLVNEPSMQTLRSNHKKLLINWMKETNDDFLDVYKNEEI